MNKNLLFLILFIGIFFNADATIYYTASSNASLMDNATPSINWTTNPNGITGLYNPMITENDEIVLLTNAIVAVDFATVNKMTVNGNATINNGGFLIVRLTTTLNAGILFLEDGELQFGDGDNNTSAGKILGSPNGTTIGINAQNNGSVITFRGGLFTSYSPANIMIIPDGTFIGNTIYQIDINAYSYFGNYQVGLNTALTITGYLTLNNGILKTSTDVNKKCVLDVDAFTDGQYTNPLNYSYVIGTLYRNTNAGSIYNFPIGGGINKYKPVSITPNSATITTYGVNFSDFELAENNPLSTQAKCAGSGLLGIQGGLQFNITRSVGGSDATLFMPYDQTPSQYWSNNGTAPNSIHNIVIAHYNATNTCWERASTATLPGNTVSNNITSNIQSNFSPFTFGYGLASVLPLQNLQFSAVAKNNYNLLQWHATNQINVKYFDIEFSEDGTNFKYAGKEVAKALGDFRYAFSHNIPLGVGDILFYRLKIIDNDGSFTYGNIVKLLLQKNIELVVYPNPASDFINVSNLKVGNVLQIINNVGAIVLQKKVITNIYKIDVSGFVKGVYLVKVVGEGGEGKFLKQ